MGFAGPRKVVVLMPRSSGRLLRACYYGLVAFSSVQMLALTVATGTSVCSSLADASSPLYSVLPLVTDMDKASIEWMRKMLAPVDAQWPWLSQCLGSANVLSVGMRAMADKTKMQCYKNLTMSTVPSIGFTDAYFRDQLCPFWSQTVLPCIDPLVSETLVALMDSAGECCDDMKGNLTLLLGQSDWSAVLQNLAVRIGDVACAIETTPAASLDGLPTNRTCGYAWIEGFGSERLMLDLDTLVQIPNAGVCSAMRGEPFVTTIDEDHQLFVNKTSVGSCFTPMDHLFSDLGAMPVFSNSSVLADGQCLSGQSVLSSGMVPDGIVMQLARSMDGFVSGLPAYARANGTSVSETVRAGMKDLQPSFGQLCFHLPTSPSPCRFESTVALAFAAESPTKTSTPDTMSPAYQAQGSANAAAAAWRWRDDALMMAILMAMAQF